MNSTSERPERFDPEKVRGLTLRPSHWAMVLIAVSILLGGWTLWGHSRETIAGLPRVPAERSEDYYLFREFTSHAISQEEILVLGDSVVWGLEAPADQTLASHLSAIDPDRDYSNSGVKGMHPLALQGLFDFHLPTTANSKPVLLHLNPLWLTSIERDFSSESEQTINHKDLIPQFWPNIPSYKADIESRLSKEFSNRIPVFARAKSLRFDTTQGQDLLHWSLEKPYSLPRFDSQSFESRDRISGQSWVQRRLPSSSYSWVDLEKSLQWQAWLAAYESLRNRDCNVCVLLGPLNENMLQEDSRQRHLEIVSQMEQTLRNRQATVIRLPTLPSEHYADLSHPLGVGYQSMAEAIWQDSRFQEWRAK